MARRTKDVSGRVTPKGGPAAAERGRPASGRYTAPDPDAAYNPSPTWYVAGMLALFILGALSIILNYLGLLPGGTRNLYLLVGLGLIVLGFVAATRYR